MSELPRKIVRKLVLLYHRVDDLNQQVDLYAKALTELDSLDPSSPRRPKLQRYINTIIDVWNTGLDHCFTLSMDILPTLERLASISPGPGEKPRDSQQTRRSY